MSFSNSLVKLGLLLCVRRFWAVLPGATSPPRRDGRSGSQPQLASRSGWGFFARNCRLGPVLTLLALALLLPSASAQPAAPANAALPRPRFRNGDETLRAFATVAALTRNSIIKLNVDGETVALATVVTTNGLALTKASELKPGKLTAWLASGEQVSAERVATDEDHDVAIVRIHTARLRPINWAVAEVTLGQWAITPGIVDTPHAVGIISALPRRIRPPRAFMGVQFDLSGTTATITQVLPGLGAEAAGLKPGDLILSLNRVAVTNREHAVELVRDCRDGQTITVRLRRGEQEITAEVRLKTPGPDESLGGLLPPQRASRVSGAVSLRAEGFDSVIQHDAVLPPWLCGGPLVNLDGKAVGLNIARAGRVATYALPARVVKQILPTLLPRAHTDPAEARLPKTERSQKSAAQPPAVPGELPRR